ncbi:hypothetical protein BV22DRAFT_1130904, partial [Leucogyrophana mollusca]
MSGDMEYTEGNVEFSLTVVGATGLSPLGNHPTGFYVVVEVDGKQGRTAELAPSPQSTIEWNACFPLRADKAAYIALRLYQCSKAGVPGHSRGHKAIWDSNATAEQLLGSGSKFTNMTLPTKAHYEEGHLVVKVERAAHTEGEGPAVAESSTKSRWQSEMRELEPSAVHSVHDIADTMYLDFEESNQREKLDEAVDHYRVSLDLRPVGHPEHFTSLSCLAFALFTRFNRFGDRADLDGAMELSRAALVLCPPGHPEHSWSLNNLASTLYTRFNQFGDTADLDEATGLRRAALVLCPQGHPDHFSSLNDLANTLSSRFNQFGARADLDEAIELNRAALALCPPGHPDRSTSLCNLANTLYTRFSQFGDTPDLDEATELHRAALAL